MNHNWSCTNYQREHSDNDVNCIIMFYWPWTIGIWVLVCNLLESSVMQWSNTKWATLMNNQTDSLSVLTTHNDAQSLFVKNQNSWLYDTFLSSIFSQCLCIETVCDAFCFVWSRRCMCMRKLFSPSAHLFVSECINIYYFGTSHVCLYLSFSHALLLSLHLPISQIV